MSINGGRQHSVSGSIVNQYASGTNYASDKNEAEAIRMRVPERGEPVGDSLLGKRSAQSKVENLNM